MQKIKSNSRAAQKRLRLFASRENKINAQRFFKSGPEGYSGHERFIGVRVPKIRLVAKEFRDIQLGELQKIIKSRTHEDRLLALIILVNRMKKSDKTEEIQLAKFFLRNLNQVNNWDLVDSSAEYILGRYLRHHLSRSQQKAFLKRLALSPNLWFRRISIMSTFHFVRHGEYANTFYIADILLNDSHDLIHKAVGWMVREVGNRDYEMATKFLRTRYLQMPRTMLRYAIEKFPEKHRKGYLAGEI